MATETIRQRTTAPTRARPIGREPHPEVRELTAWQRVAAALGGAFARVLFGIPFVIFGTFHLMMGGDMAGTVPEWLPAPTVFVYATGVLLIGAGIAFIMNRAAEPAGILLAILLATFIGTIHVPALLENPENQAAMTALLKDFGLMAGALLAARVAIGRRPVRAPAS